MLSPGIGIIFWTTLAFLIVLFILAKFAWKPIMRSIREREENIEDSLKSAEKARAEMEQLQQKNEEILKEAREERDKILKEAKESKDKIVADAKEKAQKEADQLISNAKASIENEKKVAMAELKKEVADISLDIAEKVIRKQLSGDEKQKELANQLVGEAKNLN